MSVSATPRRTGYVFEEKYMWHNPGVLPGTQWTEPMENWENADTKRRVHNLLNVSGLLDSLIPVRARPATHEEICRFHSVDYHDRIVHESRRFGGDGGDMAQFSQGGYEIAALSAGGVLKAVEAVVAGEIDNAYCLVRPPGHHAERDRGMGFCLFNNIALAALHARTLKTKGGQAVQRVAVVDYDVHHGNGTQQAFYDDQDCLFISLHQDNNYPQECGSHLESGGENAKGYNINIPLPGGSGQGAYQLVFESIVLPAVRRFQPDIILVSSGFDASYADPLGSMLLHSDSFRYFATALVALAEECCDGRIVFAHEGGYSKDYVPFCGLAVIESLCGVRTAVEDHYLVEAKVRGGEVCQPHQRVLINKYARFNGLPVPEYNSSTLTEEEDGLSVDETAVALEIQALLHEKISDPERRKAILNTVSI